MTQKVLPRKPRLLSRKGRIENDPQLASKGCTKVCHNTADDPDAWYMANSEEPYRLDRTNWPEILPLEWQP